MFVWRIATRVYYVMFVQLKRLENFRNHISNRHFRHLSCGISFEDKWAVARDNADQTSGGSSKVVNFDTVQSDRDGWLDDFAQSHIRRQCFKHRAQADQVGTYMFEFLFIQ